MMRQPMKPKSSARTTPPMMRFVLLPFSSGWGRRLLGGGGPSGLGRTFVPGAGAAAGAPPSSGGGSYGEYAGVFGSSIGIRSISSGTAEAAAAAFAVRGLPQRLQWEAPAAAGVVHL